MRMLFINRFYLFVIVCFINILVIGNATAANYTWDGSSSTVWTTGANWAGNSAPTDLSTDNITIPASCPRYPSLGNTPRTVGNLTIASGASLTMAYTGSGNRLAVNGNFVNNGTLIHTVDQYIWLLGSGKTLGGTGNFLGGVAAPFMIRPSASYTLTNSISIRHIFILTGATFDLNGYDLSTEFFFQSGTFYLRTGTLSIGGNPDASMWYNANSELGNGDTKNPWLTDANFNENTGTVYYNAGETFAAADQWVRSATYYNLKIRTNNGYTVSMGYNAAFTISNDLEILNPGTAGGIAATLNSITLNGNFYLGNTGNALTLNLDDRIARSSAGTGTFTMGNNDAHNVNVGYAHATNWGISLGAAGATTPLTFYGTVTYTSGSAQKVMNPNYKHLTISGAGSRTLTANTVINGNLTINAGTLDPTASNYDINLRGDFYNVATFTQRSNNFTFDGSTAQSITNASGTASTYAGSNATTISIPDNTPSTGVASGNNVPTAAALAAISGGASLTVNVPGGVYTGLSSINLSATHPYNGDLDFYLVSPDNTVLVISTDNGGSGDNYSNITFSDAGSVTPPTANTNFSGTTYKPEVQTFASYSGSYAGNWILYAVDDAASNTGNLTSFTITLNVIPAATLNLYNMIVNNSSSTGVTTNNDVAIVSPAVVTLTDGEFILNNHTLTLNNTATTAFSGGSNNSYVVSETNAAVNNSIIQWKMGTTTGAHVFPFGVNGTYIPFTFNKTTAGSADISVSTRASGTTNVPWAGASSVAAVTNMYSAYGGSASASVIDRWWDITKSAAVTGNLTFTYKGSENTMSISPTGTVKMQHWNGTAWDAPVGTGTGVTSGTGSVTVTGATTFSPWVAVASSAPLPIELLEFGGVCNKNNITLNWSTASENNNDYFTIEKSKNGNSFSTLGIVNSTGNSTTVKNYSLTDFNPFENTTYYRLKQTDYDGTSKTFQTIAIDNCSDSIEGVSIINAYNNKEGNIIINIDAITNETYSVKILNVMGNLLTKEKYIATKGKNNYNIYCNNFNAGVYFLIIDNGKNSITKKIILD